MIVSLAHLRGSSIGNVCLMSFVCDLGRIFKFIALSLYECTNVQHRRRFSHIIATPDE